MAHFPNFGRGDLEEGKKPKPQSLLSVACKQRPLPGARSLPHPLHRTLSHSGLPGLGQLNPDSVRLE